MANSNTKNDEQQIDEALDLSPEEIFGLSLALTLSVCVDGDVTDEEQEMLIQLLVEMVDGQATEEEARAAVVQVAKHIQKEGFEASIDAVVKNLPDVGTQALALSGVAAILLSDGETDEETEDAFFDLLVDRFGFDEELAIELWNQQAEDDEDEEGDEEDDGEDEDEEGEEEEK